MAATDYTYSVSADTLNAKVHPKTLDQEIQSSAIVIALGGVTIGGDTLVITMKDVLSSGDETILDGVVAAHTGVAAPNIPPPTNSMGAPVVQTTWREGSPTDFISFNWCDKTTWWGDSAQVTDELLTDSGDGLTWNSVNSFWICVSQGRISQEHRLATYVSVIKVDSVVLTESSRDTTDGDYQIDYESGSVTFNASQAGKTVEASYYYAQTSTYYITPAEDKILRLTAVEVQFSDDVDMTGAIRFDIEGYIHAFVPGVTVDDVTPNYSTSFPTGFRIPLGSPRIYKTMMDFIAEAQRSYPVIPALGGSTWRGLAHPLYTLRWPYQEDATRDLYAELGMRIKIKIQDDIPFGGAHAMATLYAVSTPLDPTGT